MKVLTLLTVPLTKKQFLRFLLVCLFSRVISEMAGLVLTGLSLSDITGSK